MNSVFIILKDNSQIAVKLKDRGYNVGRIWMILRKLFMAVAEALMFYGLIIVAYGILVIQVTRTWSGDWPVDRNLPNWFTLDTFMMLSFALSFFGFIAWRYLKSTEPAKNTDILPKRQTQIVS